jgi:hypothetical protein
VDTPNFRAATWRKSSYSGEYGTCVEIAVAVPLVGVRDSKSIETGHLTITTPQWTAFVGAVRADRLSP